MSDKINSLEVGVVDFDEELAKQNLKENDWSEKMTDGKGE